MRTAVGTVACLDCGKPVDPSRDYRGVAGWEQRRGAGGANAIALREETGEWLCRSCVGTRKLAKRTGGTRPLF